jgi:hypothetical protein
MHIMSQLPKEHMTFLDPFGMMEIWKQSRDANLEMWAKYMTDLVNSDEYAQMTGTALAQSLALSQPFRQVLERTMTNTLQMLNMPSRMEVTTLAERAVNIEMRLDDLDAKLNTNQKVLLAALKVTIEEAVREAMQAVMQDAVKEAVRQAMATPTRHIREIAAQLTALEAQVAALQPAAAPAVPPASKKTQEAGG